MTQKIKAANALADAEKVKSSAGGGGASVGGGGLKRSESDNDSQNDFDEMEEEKEDLARQTDEVATLADITEEERKHLEDDILAKIKALQVKEDAIKKKRDKLFKNIKAHFPTYQEFQSFSCDYSNADTVELPYSLAQRKVCLYFYLLFLLDF